MKKRSIEEQMEAMQQAKDREKQARLERITKARNASTYKRKARIDINSDPNFKNRVKQVLEVITPLVQPVNEAHHSRALPVEMELKIIAEHLVSGDGVHLTERKYGLARGYIYHVLERRFGDPLKLKQALYNLNLENAVVAHMVFQKKAEDLSAKDAAIAAGIFTQKHAELERLATQGEAPTLDVNLTLKLESTMNRLKQLHGNAIEINPK